MHSHHFQLKREMEHLEGSWYVASHSVACFLEARASSVSGSAGHKFVLVDKIFISCLFHIIYKRQKHSTHSCIKWIVF